MRVLAAVVLTLAIAEAVAAQDEAAADATLGAWHYEESVDAMTDFRRPRVISDGEGSSFIALACNRPGRGEVFVHVESGDYLGGRGTSYAVRRITYRFDDRAPIEGTWRYDSTFARSPGRQVAPFLMGMSNSTRVAFRLVRYDGRTVDVTFDVRGAREAIDRIYAACGDRNPLAEDSRR